MEYFIALLVSWTFIIQVDSKLMLNMLEHGSSVYATYSYFFIVTTKDLALDLLLYLT